MDSDCEMDSGIWSRMKSDFGNGFDFYRNSKTWLLYFFSNQPFSWYRWGQWLLREFFGRKVTFFLIYISKDPHDSGDHFNIKISVVGARCVGGKGKKLIKKSNKCQLTSDVIDDVTLMNHTSYESP